MSLRKKITSILITGLALGTIACNGKQLAQLPKQDNLYTRIGQIERLFHDDVKASRDGLGYAAADFDGDGDIDFAIARPSPYSDVILYENNGSNRWIKKGQIAKLPHNDIVSDNTGFGFTAADFDGDGDVDFAIAQLGYHFYVTLYKNDGSNNWIRIGKIAKLPYSGVVTSNPKFGFTAADFDGDGDVDFAIARSRPYRDVIFYENNGLDSWERTGKIANLHYSDVGTSSAGFGFEAADFDGDGDIDLAIVRPSPYSDVIFYENNKS